jgi:uncharacterized protein (TIGR00156 family)
MKTKLLLLLLGLLLAAGAGAQFRGPSVAGQTQTVSQVRDTRLGTYVTLTGNIVNHLRGDYFTFRDATGEIRVEIEGPLWRNVKVGPEDTVRLLGEIDRGPAGRYVWVKSIELVR